MTVSASLFPGPVGPGQRIGLLGGSFNPAHEGHLHISLIALRRLNLAQVWWLVSPQNPLKGSGDMAPFHERFASAKAMATHPRIGVSDLETRLKTSYTADTIAALLKRGRGAHFVWLMGGDNLEQFDRWKDWQAIMEALPICVLARPGYERAALRARAARTYADDRVSSSDAPLLADLEAPAWTLLQERLSPLSSTEIRRGQR